MKTIAIDFNGVIHEYSKGWQGGKIYDPILPEAINSIKTILMEGNHVFILAVGPTAAIADHMNALNLGVKFEVIPEEAPSWEKDNIVGVTNRKLPFTVLIDDRAICFKGDWRKALTEAKKFKTWQNK